MNNIEYKTELSSFIKNYPKLNYNEEWKLFVSLTYKSPIYSDVLGRKKLKGMMNHIKRKKIDCKGIFCNELDSNLNSLHHHLLLHSNKPISYLKDEIWNYWKYNGWCDIQNVKDNESVSIYITKHLGKTNINDWDFLELL